MQTYYDPADLSRFGDVGTHNRELMEKFFEYEAMAIAAEGASRVRELVKVGA